ncbi:membrane protein [Kaistia sp. 32K]|uniref:YeeE/YedE family protein n=1 Tax=Kaistia sp. 32K TaxID=2795690 RepID=UPI0019155088|nr:YeeE/YedE thiosulfate transporter family protein [Kaistia sp. 32K]BCP53570.1 membrane protein [Kaistia sp. 32K]
MLGFSPESATIGGALIGAAVGLLWIVNGRVAGISSIFGMALFDRLRDLPWRLLFLAGLPLGAAIGFALGPDMIKDAAADLPEMDLGPLGLAVSGLLVGIGTGLARGCTSGHGVFGLARLSPRSIIAVLVFMAAAIVTVFIVRHGP